MSSAKFTLIGCYQFFNNANDDLFLYINLPDGIDKDTLTSNILMTGGEYEVQYADPFFIKNAIGIWSAKYRDTLVRWIEALSIDYAPLENYDRMEHWQDDTKGTGKSDSVGSIDTTYTGETENTKSAFDSSSYQPYDKINEHSTTGTGSSDSTDTSMTSNGTHDGRIHGNIGVTTSQQMLTQELDMGYWNLYERVTDLFLREFTIPVYE